MDVNQSAAPGLDHDPSVGVAAGVEVGLAAQHPGLIGVGAIVEVKVPLHIAKEVPRFENTCQESPAVNF
jgi:hypothetical protein